MGASPMHRPFQRHDKERLMPGCMGEAPMPRMLFDKSNRRSPTTVNLLQFAPKCSSLLRFAPSKSDTQNEPTATECPPCPLCLRVENSAQLRSRRKHSG